MSTQSPRYDDVIRSTRMLLLLLSARDQRMPLNRIAERLEIHRRTAKRYVQALSVLSVNGEELVRMERVVSEDTGRVEVWVRLAPLSQR